MAPNSKPSAAAAGLTRGRLTVVGAPRPANRNDSFERVREARRSLQPRHERFAHLKRAYD